ncbi:hypothetical protein [Dendronalium sp. ChiSLP03b]|uniref:hypothetical protein n=1 Tax=Dendronalium sp. ChiSLP03b TaxID=3075381 RepID=UPI002ADB9800|nr:hypothetical protein [Dendronalium sp. ChiSLP03b]
MAVTIFYLLNWKLNCRNDYKPTPLDGSCSWGDPQDRSGSPKLHCPLHLGEALRTRQWLFNLLMEA